MLERNLCLAGGSRHDPHRRRAESGTVPSARPTLFVRVLSVALAALIPGGVVLIPQKVEAQSTQVDSSTVVPGGSVLVPEGLTTGDRFRVLFLTSTTRDASSGDIGVYNAFVQAAAAGGHESIAGHSGGFRAVASTADVDARDNTNTTGAGVSVYWLGGDKIADDYADFYDDTWDDESGVTDESASAHAVLGAGHLFVWTGSAHDGTVSGSDGLGASRPMTGYVNFAPGVDTVVSPLNSQDREANTATYPLYGLSEVFTVGPTVVPGGSVLVPEGLTTGDRFRVLFLTSTTRDASSGDIGVYNAFVQAAAAGGHESIAGHSGGFRAVASTADVDARDNTNTTGAGVSVYWLGGDKIADDYADFYDDTWDDESGVTDESASAHAVLGAGHLFVWTGSAHDGTVSGSDGLGASRPMTGYVNFAPGIDTVVSPLNSQDREADTATYPLYGLSEVFTVGPTVVPGGSVLVPEGLTTGDRFRVLFLTSTTRDASSGDIGVYNAFVQTAAAGGHESIAGHSGGFRAVASTADVDARDNTNTTGAGVSVYWLGGDKIADDYADFYDDTWDDESGVTDESASAHAVLGAGHLFVWTGSAHDGTVSGSDGLGASRPMTGYVNFAPGIDTVVSPLNSQDREADTATYPLYGLSEVFTVGPTVVPGGSVLVPEGLTTGDRFRVLFLTSTTRDASSGDIGVYNAFVQAAAAGGHESIAGHSGGFRAVASTADVDARDNTNTTGAGVSVYWLGGDKIADDYADFYDDTWDDESGVTDESASAHAVLGAGHLFVWTGSAHDGTVSGSDGLGASRPMTGYVNFAPGVDTTVSPLNSQDREADTATYPLYALSEVFTVGPDVTVSLDSLSVVEGSSASYTLVLDAEPSGSVIVDVSGDGDVTVEPVSLVFTAADWDTAQPVTVSAAEDVDTVNDFVSVTHAVTSDSAVEYVGLVVDSVVVTVNDNDTAGVSVSRQSLVVDEGGSGSYMVRLAFEPTDSVIVDVFGGGDVTVDPVSLTFTAVTWDTVQSVTVRAAEDLDATDDTETITHTVNSGSAPEYVVLSVDSVAVTVVDNDDPAVTVSFGRGSYSVAEGVSVTVRVRLSTVPQRTVVVPLIRTHQGGVSSSDYSGVPSSVRFGSGDTVASFVFRAAVDRVEDAGESVGLGFGALPVRVTAGATTEATVSIVDVEPPNRAPSVSAVAEPDRVKGGGGGGNGFAAGHGQ